MSGRKRDPGPVSGISAVQIRQQPLAVESHGTLGAGKYAESVEISELRTDYVSNPPKYKTSKSLRPSKGH